MARAAAAATTKKRTSAPPAPAAPIAAAELAAEWVAPATLKPWAKNPRKNDGEPVSKVAESIKRFGFAAPIVARRETGEIIAGHTRWKAAMRLSLPQVPVRYLDITESEAHLLALADNRLGELADWDVPELHTLLASYDAEEAVLAGWEPVDLEALAPSLERAESLPKTQKDDNNHCPHCGRFMSEKIKAAHRSRAV